MRGDIIQDKTSVVKFSTALIKLLEPIYNLTGVCHIKGEFVQKLGLALMKQDYKDFQSSRL